MLVLAALALNAASATLGKRQGGVGGAARHARADHASDAALPHSCSQPTRILITGISGMIGSHVANVLVSRPCVSLFGLVRPRTDLSALHGILIKVTLLKGDITDEARMIEVVRLAKPHYVYHFAAQAINGISFSMAAMTLDTNVQGTRNILEGVRTLRSAQPEVDTRVLLAGSSTEYGKTADTFGAPIPESAPLQP
eukprot:2606191-Prymnesium_polylepis.1